MDHIIGLSSYLESEAAPGLSCGAPPPCALCRPIIIIHTVINMKYHPLPPPWASQLHLTGIVFTRSVRSVLLLHAAVDSTVWRLLSVVSAAYLAVICNFSAFYFII